MHLRPILAISIVLLIVSCKKNYDDMLATSLEKKDYVSVRVASVSASKESLPIYAMGRISSDTETKLSYKTGGYVAGLYVREGDYVRRGKLLGRLRTEEIDAQVLKAERALDKSRRDLDRVTAMYRDSVATLENVQDLTTLVEVGEADLKIALYNQQYSKIVSPVSGRVLRRLAEPNELVSPGQPIYVIASSGKESYIMKVYLSDKDIGMVSYGTPAKLTFDAFADQEFEARVNRISESADPMTGTFEIELSINPGKTRMRNGLIGRASLYPTIKDAFVKIPMESIIEGEGSQATIFIPDENGETAISQQIDVARFGNEYVLVIADELPISTVITSGSAYLKEGQKIKIIQ